MTITYAEEPGLTVAEFRHVLRDGGLPIRALDDPARLRAMLSAANLVLTARRDGALLGVARCLTDFAWVAYLSEIAVVKAAQGTGVGRGLLGVLRTRLGPGVTLVLNSVPTAAGFYDAAGMDRLERAFRFPRSV